MHAWPGAHCAAVVHIGFASDGDMQMPVFGGVAVELATHLPRRASTVRQYESLAHSNRQYPWRHVWFVEHCDVIVQFGVGRVSGTHAPWLQ